MKIIINREEEKPEIPKVPFVFKHNSGYFMAVTCLDGKYQFVVLCGENKGVVGCATYDNIQSMLYGDKIVESELIIHDKE